MDEPPAHRGPRVSDATVGWVCVGVLTLLAALTALWAVVLLPPIVGPELLPRIAESLLIAGPGVYLLTLYAGRAASSRMGALIPAATWVIVVVVLGAGRPEGDNPYLLSSYQGLLLAPLGMAASALGVVRAQRTPWPPDSRAPNVRWRPARTPAALDDATAPPQ